MKNEVMRVVELKRIRRCKEHQRNDVSTDTFNQNILETEIFLVRGYKTDNNPYNNKNASGNVQSK